MIPPINNHKDKSLGHLRGGPSSSNRDAVVGAVLDPPLPRNESLPSPPLLLVHQQHPSSLCKARNPHNTMNDYNRYSSPLQVQEMFHQVVESDEPEPLVNWLRNEQGWKGERNISILGSSTMSLLEFAVNVGPRTTKALLDAGLDIQHLLYRQEEDNTNCTATTTKLHYAAAHGKVSILRLLLERGANPNLLANGKSVLIWALDPASPRIAACVRTLLDHGADPNFVAHEDVLTLPPPPPPPPNYLNNLDCFVPLLRAIQLGAWSAAELLLWAGADPNAASPDTLQTALFAARTPLQISSLLRCGANVHHQDKRGRTALHELACDCQQQQGSDNDQVAKRVASMQLLLHAGADPNATDHEGVTPLHCVCSQWNEDLFDFLTREFQADVLCVDYAGRTALHHANGNPKAIHTLVTRGVNPRATCRLGRTFLHETVLRRVVKMSPKQQEQQRPLLDPAFCAFIVDVNATDIHGWTALHYASFLGHTDTVSWLIEAGANLSARDVSGRTPMHVTGLHLVLHSPPTVDIYPAVDEIANDGELNAKPITPNDEACFTQGNRPDYHALKGHCCVVSTKNNGASFIAPPPGPAESAVEALIVAGADCMACDNEGNGPWTFASQASEASLGHIYLIVQAAASQGLFG